MKKSIAIVLGVASLAACTKSSVSYEQTDEISFAPVASVNKTKAAVDRTAFPDANLMGVYAYYNSKLKADTQDVEFVDYDSYLAQATFKKNNNGVWAGWNSTTSSSNPYYWPKTGSLLFAAYSPETPALTHNFAVNDSKVTDKFTASDYVQSSDLSKTVDLLWSPVTNISYDKATGATGVPMTFYHAMSWVTINVKAASSTAKDKFAIKFLKLKSVAGKGDLTTDGSEITWTNLSAEADLNVFASEDQKTTVKETAATLEKVSNGTVVIPQDLTNVKLEVVFQQASGVADAWTAEQTVTIDLKDCKKSDNTTISAWENGKHYIYTLSFGIDEITINPDVKKWDDVDVADITVQ